MSQVLKIDPKEFMKIVNEKLLIDDPVKVMFGNVQIPKVEGFFKREYSLKGPVSSGQWGGCLIGDDCYSSIWGHVTS